MNLVVEQSAPLESSARTTSSSRPTRQRPGPVSPQLAPLPPAHLELMELLERTVVKMKSDEDKTKVLSPHLLMAYSGEPGQLSPTLSLIAAVRLLTIALHHQVTPCSSRNTSSATSAFTI